MQPFQIPNKYHPLTKDFTGGTFSNHKPSNQDQKIAKYAPRVLKSYILADLKNSQSINALKRVKRIRVIQDDPHQSSLHQWRLLLQNKFKTIMIYDNEDYEWQSLKKYKAFLNATQALLKDDDLSQSLMRYLPINLRRLDVFINPSTHPDLLTELNSMPRVLSRLKTFKMEWFLVGENNIPFSCLAENDNVRKYLTHLSTEGIQEDIFLEQFPRDCKNLIFLSANFPYASPDRHCSYLRVLEIFQKFEGITIFSEDIGSFIENFTLPTSIKYVCLNLNDAYWSELYKELFSEEIESFTSSMENSLLENKKLASFSEKWKNLSNLVTLKISAKHTESERLFTQAFIKLILKSVPNLVNLELEIGGLDRKDFNVNLNLRSISLTQIFLACKNYSDRLEEIKLSFPTKYPLTCQSVEGVHFPKLKLLQLQNNEISDVTTLENLFKIIKRPVLENDVKILLDKFVVKTNQTLLNLLEVLQKSPRNSKIELTIEVNKLSFETFDNMFEAFIEKMKRIPAVQNVSLEVQIHNYFYSEGSKALSFLNEMFKNVRFSEEYVSKFRNGYDFEISDEDDHLDSEDEE